MIISGGKKLESGCWWDCWCEDPTSEATTQREKPRAFPRCKHTCLHLHKESHTSADSCILSHAFFIFVSSGLQLSTAWSSKTLLKCMAYKYNEHTICKLAVNLQEVLKVLQTTSICFHSQFLSFYIWLHSYRKTSYHDQNGVDDYSRIPELDLNWWYNFTDIYLE